MRHPLLLIIILIFSFFAETGLSAQTPGGEQPAATVCIGCHTSDIMKPEFLSISGDWKKSWHYQNNISCHDCHGGDPKDEEMAMSPQRGFVGKPQYTEVPGFCGKCHISILKHYLESGHGKALESRGTGPNCVTCHSSHNTQKADINIINEERCSRCHSYERAKLMKQALFITEKKIRELDEGLTRLKHSGVFTEEQDKNLFSTHAEFRTLFHSVDVSLIKDRTDEFINRLDKIEMLIREINQELMFRRNFSVFLMVIFLGLGIVLYLLSKTREE